MKHHRKVLVIGNFRLPLGPKPKHRRTRGEAEKTTHVTARAYHEVRDVFAVIPDTLRAGAAKIKARTFARKTPLKNPIAGKTVRIAGRRLPAALLTVVVLLVATIVPTAMAFGSAEPQTPTGANLGNSIEITSAYFYPGAPNDGGKIAIGQDTTKTNGVVVQNAEYTLFFEWRLKDPAAAAANGDWFDVTVDLGLTDIPAKIKEQKGASLSLGSKEKAGNLQWINAGAYTAQANLTLRVTVKEEKENDEKITGGTGLWGFRYDAGKKGGNTNVIWQITVGDAKTPAATTSVIPRSSGDPAEGGALDPYDKKEPGYSNLGQRLTTEKAAPTDTIFAWNIFINGHKHKTLEEWAACPNNTDANTLNDDPAPQAGETFTIIDTGTGLHPTWLRDVTAADGKAVIDPKTPVLIDKSDGRYGNGTDDRRAAAYLKLFYVNSEVIWQERIDQEDAGYKTPSTDRLVSHKPSEGHPVGAYDPYYSTRALNEGEESALLYAPNYSAQGENYYNYFTPVPPSDIKSITLTDNGFEIEMFTDAILGRTLAIGYMAEAQANAQGAYGQNVSNSIAIKGVNDERPVAVGAARVLLGSTDGSGYAASLNKGKFILETRNRHTAQPMAGVAFDIKYSNGTEDVTMKTNESGKIELSLPPLPWSGNLTLTIAEQTPEGYAPVSPVTVTLEPGNGTVLSAALTEDGDKKLLGVQSDRYGILLWNKSANSDTDYYDAALRTFVKKVERDAEDGTPRSVFLNSEPNTDIPDVENGDRVLFRVDVYNQSRKAVQVTKITEYLPPGLTFDPAATVQHPDDAQAPYTNALWQLKEGTNNVVEYIGPPIDFAWNIWLGTEGVYPEHRLPLVLTVDTSGVAADGSLLTSIAEITELQDLNGNKVEDIDSTPDANKDNDGQTPGVDYGETPPPGTVLNNDIEGHRINEKGEPDRAADEDDQDYAQVRLPRPVTAEGQNGTPAKQEPAKKQSTGPGLSAFGL